MAYRKFYRDANLLHSQHLLIISGAISLKDFGVNIPEILAEVETKGFFIRSISLKQKGSFTIRTPKGFVCCN
jgi:hypothetical protein